MTGISVGLACCFLFCCSLFAQTPDQLFVQGNEAFQKGQYAEARDAFERIRSQGYESGALYYNLGNAYYKSGSIALAILNYERALRLLPGDDDILHNLAIANLAITDKIEVTPRLFLWDYWDALKDAMSTEGYIWLAYVFFASALIAVSIMLLSSSYAMRKLMFLAAVVCGLLFLPSLGIAIAKNEDQQRTDIAIVTADIVTIKNSPDETSSDAFVLHSGVKVQVTDRINQWLKVRLGDGKVGWLNVAAVEVI